MEESFLGRKALKYFGKSGSVYKFFYPDDKPEEKYYQNKLRIGYQEGSYLGKKVKEDFWLNVGESYGFVILGMRGSGKSYLNHRICDTAYNTGFACVFLTDIKNEVSYYQKSASAKYVNFLAKNEEARPTPVACFYPTYLGKPPRGNDSFQISLQDLDYTDLITIYGLENSGSISQLSALNEIHDKIKLGEIINVDDVLLAIEENEDISMQTKKSLRAITKSLDRNRILGDDFEINLEEIFSKNQIPVLDLLGYERMGINISSAFVAIFLRKIIEARRDSLIKKPMMIFVDEAHEFANIKKDLTSKEEILKTLRVSRSWGISMGFMSQSLSSIPQEIVDNCRYVFVPQNYGPQKGREILKQTVGVELGYDEYNEIIYLFKNLKKKRNGEREWLLIDRDKKSYKAFFPYAPLSLHKSEIRW